MSDFLDTDFSRVKTQLQTKFNILLDPTLEARLRRLHKTVFCMCSLQYEFCKIEPDRMDFLKELRSDYVHALIQFTLGIKKATVLFMRASIEDTLRHIFYNEHPVELFLLNESSDNRMKIDELFQYIRKHPSYRRLQSIDEVVNYLSIQYSETSKLIHGSSAKHLQLHRTISEVKLKDAEMDSMIDDIEKLADNLMTLLILFHKRSFDKIHPEPKRLILSSLSNKNKRIIHNIQ
jgi:hypothetical protein